MQTAPAQTPREAVKTTMQAFVLEGNDIASLHLRTPDKPKLGPGEVLIRAKAISLNPIDIVVIQVEAVRNGLYGPPDGTDIIPGWDVAGEVVVTDPSVTKFKPGDRVFGCIKFPGKGKAYAEDVAAPADQLALIPDGVTFESAAAAGLAAITAYEALVVDGKLSKNDKVLIHGAAGGVGHFAVQIAKSFGAYVVATASAGNLDFVRAMGADEVIDYQKQKFEAVVQDADLVLDSIGDANLLRSLDAVKKGGRVVSLKGDFEGDIDKKTKAKGVTGIRFGVHSNGVVQQKIADLLASGKLVSAIYKTWSFEDLPKACDSLEKVGYGKVVVKVD